MINDPNSRFDEEHYNRNAINGDLGGIAIQVSAGLWQIAKALDKLSRTTSVDITAELNEIRSIGAELEDRFDRLTGWKAEI